MTEWKDDDEFTTTYGTLKRSMVEAADAERERIVALLEEAFMSQNYSWDWDEPAPRKMDTKWVRFRGDVLALIKGEAK
jgi:hypothetical protein